MLACFPLLLLADSACGTARTRDHTLSVKLGLFIVVVLIIIIFLWLRWLPIILRVIVVALIVVAVILVALVPRICDQVEKRERTAISLCLFCLLWHHLMHWSLIARVRTYLHLSHNAQTFVLQHKLHARLTCFHTFSASENLFAHVLYFCVVQVVGKCFQIVVVSGVRILNSIRYMHWWQVHGQVCHNPR